MKIKSLLALILLSFVSACSSQKSSEAAKEVHLAIWSNYVTEAMMEEFEAKTGLRPVISNYSSNEELLAKLQAGATGYDVIVPSDYMVEVMIKIGLLEPLAISEISAYGSLDPQLLGLSFDPKNAYSVPLNWGTTGIAVNTKKYNKSIEGWKDVFENRALANEFTLLDDVRETMGAALRVQGKSINSTDPKALSAARDLLVKAKPSIKGFNSEILAGLVNGEMWLAHAYSSDALKARKQTNGAIDYIIPKEGCTRWVDNLVIPKGSKNPAGAIQLINFLLSPEVSAKRTEELLVIPSNLKTKTFLPKSLQSDRALFPSKAMLARCEMIQDLGPAISQWDRFWTEAKAAH